MRFRGKYAPQPTMSSTGREARCRSAAPSPSPRHPPPTPAKGRASTLTVASNSPNFATPTAYDEQWTQRWPRDAVFCNIDQSCWLSSDQCCRRSCEWGVVHHAEGEDKATENLGRLGRGGRNTRAGALLVKTHVQLRLELNLDAYAANNGSAAASSSDGDRGKHKLTAVRVL
ncbi:unnamed protein product [Vitrella brassicaformis CCMP3155]|uniref:Uncharacterized protein n=1 Tax=Vitrella brassicaformis (strain CCMP3155) TaxID=1169540 RepID=A0A0G4GGW7_VITBC|nr:unnamed protein product [Vitrella brassicaformis CCMP3155]|eukprot:CEM28874.1 unnamed protein product [Vitrella brassicaformis CCMP3155]